MERIELEEIANEFFLDAIKARKQGKMEIAISYMAVSWGYNRYIERTDFMTLCTRLLRSFGLSEEEIKMSQDFGYENILFGFKLAEAVKNSLNENHQTSSGSSSSSE